MSDKCPISNSTTEFESSEDPALTCQCRGSELLVDVQGLKLDQVIDEGNINNNVSRINNIESLLAKFQSQADEMQKKIVNIKAEVSEPVSKYAKEICKQNEFKNYFGFTCNDLSAGLKEIRFNITSVESKQMGTL